MISASRIVDVVHALFVEGHAFLEHFLKGHALGLHPLDFRLPALDFSHDNQRVLKLVDRLLKVHLTLSIAPEHR